MPEWKERISGENNGFYGKHHTEETKQKLREINIGREGYWKTHEITSEMRENMSKNHADITGEKNPMYGHTHTKEARERMSKSNGKKVYCDGRVFDTCKECAKYFNVCYQSLSKVLTGIVPLPKTWSIKTVYYLDDE
nr:MAG TPA: group I intron endonuclease [Caudoviricetes sp.]